MSNRDASDLLIYKYEELFDEVLEADVVRAAEEPPPLEVSIEPDLPGNILRCIEFLKVAPPAIEGEGGDHQTVNTAMKCNDLGVSEGTALELMAEHYNPRCVPEWDYEELRLKVRNGYRYKQNPFGRDTAQFDFQKYATTGTTTADDLGLDALGLPPAPPKRTPDLLKEYLNDQGNEKRFEILYGESVRYCNELKKWLVYDGKRWAVDRVQKAKKLMKRTLTTFYAQAAERENKDAQKFANQSLKNANVEAALSMAQSSLPIEYEKLDQQPYLLNFLNGTVDLRTGAIKPHDRNDFITKIIHCNYNPNAEAPHFKKFLNRIQPIEERVDFLQRAFGYSLTGDTSEKCIFLCVGGGDNGKTTLLQCFRRNIREYAAVIQIDSIMTSKPDADSRSDISDLRGARYAITSETKEGQKVNESTIKRITQGGDSVIKSSRKYENVFEFAETQKLWVDGNHKPVIGGTDDAIWSRLCVIPFDEKIPKAEQDGNLKTKLASEIEGVMAWALPVRSDGTRKDFIVGRQQLAKPSTFGARNRTV